MKPTMNLRYLQIKVPTISNVYGGYNFSTKLQQQWISKTGETEWRDVEIIKEACLDEVLCKKIK